MKKKVSIVSVVAILIALLIGILVIVGWYIHSDFLRSIVPSAENDKRLESFNLAFTIFLASVFILLLIILFSIRSNISDRKTSEKRLAVLNNELEQKVQDRTRNLALFMAIVNSSDDAILSKSLDGIIATWNHGAEKLFGYSESEAIGKNVSMLIPLERLNEENEIMAKIRRGDYVKHYETERLRKDGSIVSISLTVSPITDSSGAITGASKIARDISDRKKVEAALRASEELYRKLFENMLNGFVYCQVIFEGDKAVDYICTAVNSAYETMTGLSGAFGKKISELIPGIQQTHPEILEMIGRVSLSGKPEKFETFILDRWLSVSLYCPEKGYFVGLVDNITDRKQAATQIEYQANLLKNINDAVIATDEQLRITAWNPAAEKMYGWKESEVLGQTTDILVSEMTLPERELALQELKAFGAFRSELVQYHQNGQPLTVETNAIALYNEHKQFGGLLTVNRDISEKKIVEEKLADSERRFRALIENSSEGIALTDEFSNIIYRSPSVQKITGVSLDDRKGNAIGNTHPEDLEMMKRKLAEAKAKPGVTIPFQGRFLHKQGHYFWMEGTLTNLLHVKGVNALVTNFRDITDRKLQEAYRLKGDFLANMSHELRTPLNAVLGFSELLIDKRVGALNAKQLEYLNDIHASGSHLLRLINDILDLSKIESGKTELSIESFSVTEVVRGVASSLKPMADKRQIQIEQSLSTEIDAVSLDKHKFRQILYNLLSNAIKFSRDQGIVRIETSLHEKTTFKLRVSDQGIGIAKEDQKKLFVPFVQLDSGLGRRHQGTGLGLALTRNIVLLQNGEISVESTPGVGSTFTVTLPIVYKEPQPSYA